MVLFILRHSRSWRVHRRFPLHYTHNETHSHIHSDIHNRTSCWPSIFFFCRAHREWVMDVLMATVKVIGVWLCIRLWQQHSPAQRFVLVRGGGGGG